MLQLRLKLSYCGAIGIVTTARWRAAALYRRLGPATPCTRVQGMWLLAVVGVAFALRLAWSIYAARPAQGFQDPFLYHLYGLQIANGNGYHLLDGEPTAYNPIGYPAALGAVFWLFLHTPLPDDQDTAVGAFNLVLGMGTVVITFDLARRLFDNRTGLVAAGVMALFPNVVFHTAVALTETLFNLLVMAALLVLLGRCQDARPGSRRLAAFGLLLGASALVRPISLFFLPVLGFVWLRGGIGWRPALRGLGIVAVAAAVLIAPWTVRNIVVMESPVVISTNIGDNLCMSRHPDATGGFQLDSPCFRGLEDVERPEYEIRHSSRNLRKAIEFVVDHPLDEMRLLLRRAYYTLRHDHDGLDAAESYGLNPFVSRGWRDVLEVTADGFFFVALALALLAVPAFVSGRDRRRLFFLLAMASMAASPLIFFGNPRFHVPVVPFLAVGSAVTLVRIRDSLAPR